MAGLFRRCIIAHKAADASTQKHAPAHCHNTRTKNGKRALCKKQQSKADNIRRYHRQGKHELADLVNQSTKSHAHRGAPQKHARHHGNIVLYVLVVLNVNQKVRHVNLRADAKDGDAAKRDIKLFVVFDNLRSKPVNDVFQKRFFFRRKRF